tara:strand:+ start:311 stop:1402 length:1092 start_codon:yes stop_codon:yes gene_type:complete
MAYDSDTQVKNILREIHEEANLKSLIPRFFAESRDDHKLWEDGGLTFKQYDVDYGSNDFGWFVEEDCFINGKECSKKPIIIVEATLGLRHGNTGSAQLARFSHALGACHNGACGILFQDYVWEKARTAPDLIYAALKASEQLDCPYLVVDVNDRNLMIKILKAYDSDDEKLIKKAVKEALSKMNDHLEKHKIDMTKKRIVLKEGSVIEVKVSELINSNKFFEGLVTTMWFDFENFTDSTKRNGHTILGEGLIFANIVSPAKHYFLLPRMFKKDIEKLKKTKGKEQTLLFKHPNMELLGFDDLICNDQSLKQSILEMRGKSFKGEREIKEKKLSAEKYFSTQRKNQISDNLKKHLINGSIKIKV